jgi:hypothetical protein
MNVRSAHIAVFMCFVWIAEQTAIISLCSVNWLVFITEMGCVYCAVRTGYLNKIQVIFPLLTDEFTFNINIWGNIMKTLTNSLVNFWSRQQKLWTLIQTCTMTRHIPEGQFYCTAVKTPRFATYSRGRPVIRHSWYTTSQTHTHTHTHTVYMSAVRFPSWQANILWASQQIPSLSYNTTINFCFYKAYHWRFRHFNPVNTITAY